MATQFERDIIKRSCEKLKIHKDICNALLEEIGKFTTINEEAEYWLNEKNKKITEKRVEILVRECDDAMERIAKEIEEEE